MADGLHQAFHRARTPLYDLPNFKGSGTYRMAAKLLRSGFTFHYLRIDHIGSRLCAYDAQSHRWISFESHVSVAAEVKRRIGCRLSEAAD